MTELFNNKYYNQLFGGKKEEQQRQQRQQRQQDEESMSTEDTRQRLERIFGGAKGKKGSAKPKVAAARKSDAEILAEGKVKDAGKKNGKQVFEFKNGALAVRDASGRFVIVQGASKATMDALRARRTGPKAQRISANQAKKAFSAYWNRKMREAASHDRKHGLKGRASHKAAVKRSKSYHMKYAHKNPARHLSPESDKGYLYLRKERILRDSSSGMPLRNKHGKVSVRRAGPAIYDFIGVAPEVLQMSKRTGSAAAIARARSMKSKRASSRALVTKSASTRKAAMMAAREELHPAPMARGSRKAVSASKKVRKTRSNAGKPRGSRKAKKSAKKPAKKSVKKSNKKSAAKVAQHIRFSSTSSKKASAKKARKTRSNAGKPRGPRKGKATATVEEM